LSKSQFDTHGNCKTHSVDVDPHCFGAQYGGTSLELTTHIRPKFKQQPSIKCHGKLTHGQTRGLHCSKNIHIIDVRAEDADTEVYVS
jgi:hypothetical protein